MLGCKRSQKAFFSTVLGILLIGLVVSIVSIQPVVAEQLKRANQTRLFQSNQVAQLTASDGTTNDAFGWSVAVSGDTIAVGATGDDNNKGSVYVFVKPSGGWSGVVTETAKLIASDGVAGDLFGYAVEINGDSIIAGAISHDNFKGSAYIFVKPGSGWSGTLTETAKLVASDGAVGDSFGTSVALSHDTAIVSADYDDVGANGDQGSAYVFVKPGSGWSGTVTETARLIASDGATDDAFGTSTRISGDTVVVGARSNDGSHRGSAYIFMKPGSGWSGTLTETAKLIPSDGTAGDFFGVSVRVSGNTVVSGAIFHNLNQGAVYTFVKPTSGWSGTLTETAKLVASDGEGGDRLGVSVAISGDTVVGGADLDDNQGTVYRFVRPQSDWSGILTETAKLIATDGMTNDLFGGAVAISGATTVAGAINSNDDRGSAYVFVTNTIIPVYLPVILK